LKYYLIAGERSGDLHAGNYIKALKEEDKEAQVRAWGGEYVEEAGADLVVHYNEIAVMGFLEVLKQFSKIKKYLKLCEEDIVHYHPDVVVLVDFGGFNLRIAKFCKKNNIKVFYYISPKVWAWNQSRALKLKRYVDRMFCILPFEKTFFKKYDWEVDYVGNPVMDAVKAHVVDEAFKQKWGIQEDSTIIALLPGSRRQELNNMLPVMRQVVKQFPDFLFVVAAIRNFEAAIYSEISSEPNVVLVHEDTYNLLANSTSAIVTSGTATLETALWNVPQVVPYKSSPVTMFIAKLLVKLKYISLVNLIVDKEVVKEFIQENMTVENISAELMAITKGKKRDKILRDYKELFSILGEENVSEKMAKLTVQYMKMGR